MTERTQVTTTTRFNAGTETPRRAGDLPTGYDGRLDPPEGLTVPPCGVEDVDAAVYEAFSSGLGLQVQVEGDELRAPSVVFATGERWALIKRHRGVRDKATGALILPIITITRGAPMQSMAQDIAGRGINQQTGELVVARRLDRTDRGHQNRLNALFLRNQQNVAVPVGRGAQGQLATRGSVGERSLDGDVVRGALLAAPLTRNVVETITVPAPQFFTVTYEVTFWTQHLAQMNQLWERLVSALLPQGNSIVLRTEKGYWFVGTVDGDSHQPEGNLSEVGELERVVRHKLSLKVPAYLLAGPGPGAPVPVRRTVSSPVVSFTVEPGGAEPATGEDTVDDPHLGADDPTLPLDPDRTRRPDRRRTGAGRLVPPGTVTSSDPALGKLRRGTSPARYLRHVSIDPVTGRRIVENIRIASSNPSAGETVYSSSPTGGLDGLAVVVTGG